jgi:hypothetical protein
MIDLTLTGKSKSLVQSSLDLNLQMNVPRSLYGYITKIWKCGREPEARKTLNANIRNAINYPKALLVLLAE